MGATAHDGAPSRLVAEAERLRVRSSSKTWGSPPEANVRTARQSETGAQMRRFAEISRRMIKSRAFPA
ncbi:hypothetical protein EHH60_34275 [Bradyrhizobium sp. RP6]|nr:hypothetical protein EHH60_34275 [Bradyrhizobium sp. RP6]